MTERMAMQVPQQRIRQDGPAIPLFSLGSWYTYDRMDFDEAVAMLRLAVERGANLFDVAVYGRYPQKFPLSNPRHGRVWTDVIFSRAMQQAGIARSAYMVAAKIWLWAYPRLSIREQLDHAMLRLGTDYVDFVMLGDIEDDLDLGEIVREVAALIADGKVRWWGVNNWSATELRRAHDYAAENGLPKPQIAQLKYNVSRRTKPEDAGWLDLFRETGIGLQASDVFESGYFAGKTELTRGVARDPGDIRPLIQQAATRFADLARELGTTPAQLALSFCLTHPAIASVLFGCSSVRQFEENLGALTLFEKHGQALRGLVEEFWFDRDRIDPTASWSARPLDFTAPAG